MGAVWLVIHAAILGPMKHAPGRVVLAIVSIALGVALGLAIHLINRTAADEISLAARSLYGLADLSIEGSGEGLDESLYPLVARTPGVAAASPVVQIEAKLVGERGAITLLGVDPFRSQALQPAFAAGVQATGGAVAFDPDAVWLSTRAASALNLQPGDSLRVQVGLQPVSFRVAGILPSTALAERAAVIDIATAQWRFNRLGRLSRIDVRLQAGASLSAIRTRLGTLAPAARIQQPGEAGEEAVRLSRAYRSNLTALALVALFTGGFFVYSTQALQALRRRREFAIFHALGMTRGAQRGALLSGAALMGVLGAALGLVLGVVIARVGLARLGADLGAGYFRGVSADIALSGVELIVFGALGLGVAMVGALRPALEAARTPTATALKAGDVSAHHASLRGVTRLGIALLLLAALLLWAPPIGGLPLAGYAAIALLLIGFVMCSPVLIQWSVHRAPAATWPPYQIALAQVSGASRYATLSVSSIIVSFSLMTAMAIMVTSFRDSLAAWTERVLPADLYVRVGYVGQSAAMDPSLVKQLGAFPGVARLESSRFAEIEVEGVTRPVTLIARSLDPQNIARSLWIREQQPIVAGEGIPVWINEAAVDLFAWRPGEKRSAQLGEHNVQLVAAGVWRDYEHQRGAILLELDEYVALTGDPNVNTLWFWLDEQASSTVVAQAIRDAFPPGAEFEMRTPQELRRLSLAAFDRTFAVTYLLEAVAVVIGLFGIAAGVSAQVISRRGEFGALRHLGFTRAQIAAMLAIEGATLGVLGVVLGLVAGVLIGFILIYIVNRQSFHWSMDLSAPIALLGGLSAALIGSAALIAVIAGRQALSGEVVSAVKEDW